MDFLSQNQFYQNQPQMPEAPKAPENSLTSFTPPDEPVKPAWYKNIKIIVPVIIAVILIGGGVWAGFMRDDKEPAEPSSNAVKPVVQTVVLDENKERADEVRASGVVKADSKVDVIALGSGNLRNVYFKVGDQVRVNQLLATLHDQTLITTLNNAQIQYQNSQQSYASFERLTDEAVRQAEAGVRNAETAVQSAQNAYDNAQTIQISSKADAFNNAVVSYYGYSNTVTSALNQINYLIGVEGNQMPDIDDALSVKNETALNEAKSTYRAVNNTSRQLALATVTADTVIDSLGKMTQLISQTKEAVDQTLIALDYSITTLDFTESDFIAKKEEFTVLRATIVGAQTNAQSTLQNLQNIDLVNKRELDGLQNAITAAQNQLVQAQTALQNAKASKEQQLVGARGSVNSAQGQLANVGTQLADLQVKTPIAGTITKQYAELGAELSPGQKIAEVSQTNLMKVVIEVTSQDVYKLQVGQEAVINNELTGTISRIDPAADPLTKKVGVEIAFDNSRNKLIAETFVDVVITVDGRNGAEFTAGTFFIPLKAVAMTQTEQYVFIVRESRAVKTPVTVGTSAGDKIQIIAGLRNGDELIVSGNRGLEGGEEVVVKN